MARWTLKEVIQGKPIKRPTHPMVVFFPISFTTGALLLDVLSRIGLQGMVKGSTVILGGAVVTAALAILTGLFDRSDMRVGSRIHRVATRHMYIQSTASALFVANFIVHLIDRNASTATVPMLVLDALSTITVFVGGDVGVQMVFRYGARVSIEQPALEEASITPGTSTQSPTAAAD